MSTHSSLNQLTSTNKSVIRKLSALNIHSIEELLLHFPKHYQNRNKITSIATAHSNQYAVIEGTVIDVSQFYSKQRRQLNVRLSDHSGTIALRFLHFSNPQKKRFDNGGKVRCFGEIRRSHAGLIMFHPEYEWLTADVKPVGSTHLTAIYPSTKGLSQTRLRQLIDNALQWLKCHPLAPSIPTHFWSKLNCQDQENSIDHQQNINDIIRTLHKPPIDIDINLLAINQHPMQRRLIVEELMAHQLSMISVKHQMRNNTKATKLPIVSTLEKRFLAQLPFDLTNAQWRVIDDIRTDLQQPYPMQRLLQGDVGSGKTLVICMAMLQAIGNGKQVAMMVPTEILAQQHLYTLKQWFNPLDIEPIMLSGKSKGKDRQQCLQKIIDGSIQLIIGTHALLQTDVIFNNLAFIVIDEQHRFGVNQRLAFNHKGQQANYRPHQLIATATPIPRTLAMSYYGTWDSSTIDELPPRRKPVETCLINQNRRSQVIDRIANACKQGMQVYWVCTLIEVSEVLQSEAAINTAEELQILLPNLSIGLIHSKIKNADKSQLMERFSCGEIDILVATTVIEVGVDVANANLMIIDNAERLGLAQLHQLRGRVGRSERQSYCILLYATPLSSLARQRLQVMRQTNDGFKIAAMDLRLRGPGEIMGVRQTGELHLRLADLQNHTDLLELAREGATKLFQSYPTHAQTLIDRWLPNATSYQHT